MGGSQSESVDPLTEQKADNEDSLSLQSLNRKKFMALSEKAPRKAYVSNRQSLDGGTISVYNL